MGLTDLEGLVLFFALAFLIAAVLFSYWWGLAALPFIAIIAIWMTVRPWP